MGPRNPGHAPSSSAILIRVQPDEYLRIAAAAEGDGRSMAGFVKWLIRRQIEPTA